MARILANSKLRQKGIGNVVLNLAEECQEQTTFEIASKYCTLSMNVNMNLSKFDNKYYLNSKLNIDNTKKFVIDCVNSNVTVNSMNWSEMFALQFKKRKDV